MANELNERWLPIPGYEGFYSVSDYGRVRSEARRIVPRDGMPSYMLRGKILKPSAYASGHVRVSLSRNSRIRSVTVHSLVLLAFVGARPQGADICHGDGNPLNNQLCNLRYDTRAENIADCKAHGRFSEAQRHPVAILTDAQALAIYHARGESAAAIAARYGVKPMVVNQIWRGETWKSVTGGKPVTGERGRATYYRTILTREKAAVALHNRAHRTGQRDGRGIKPTAVALGVDTEVIRTLYRAVDARKPVIYAE